MSNNRKTALITGASSGIGRELSGLFAADGDNVVLVARSEDKLNSLAAELRQRFGVEALVLSRDLSDPAAPAAIFEALQARGVQVDFLVNNAGYGIHGLFAENQWADELNMMQVNMVAMTHLTKLFLPGMLERGFGRVLNVGSTGSFAPGPLMAVYCASKAYVLSFSEAVADELRGSGVSVTALCPGVTITGFQERAQVNDIRMVKSGAMSAQRVAKLGYQAMMKGRSLIVPGVHNRLLAVSMRPVPGSWAARAGRILMESAG